SLHYASEVQHHSFTVLAVAVLLLNAVQFSEFFPIVLVPVENVFLWTCPCCIGSGRERLHRGYLIFVCDHTHPPFFRCITALHPSICRTNSSEFRVGKQLWFIPLLKCYTRLRYCLLIRPK